MPDQVVTPPTRAYLDVATRKFRQMPHQLEVLATAPQGAVGNEGVGPNLTRWPVTGILT